MLQIIYRVNRLLIGENVDLDLACILIKEIYLIYTNNFCVKTICNKFPIIN